MAVSKSVEKTRLLVRVENTDGSLKNLAFNNIRESASDEELLHAGKAIAGLQVKALDSVRRSDVAVLTANNPPEMGREGPGLRTRAFPF